jgi:amidophosphoribosyltransferase
MDQFPVYILIKDAAGIVTCGHKGRFYQRKGNGMVRDVFDQKHLQNLVGSFGIGHGTRIHFN